MSVATEERVIAPHGDELVDRRGAAGRSRLALSPLEGADADAGAAPSACDR